MNTNIVNYLSSDLKQHCFQITFKKMNVKSLKNCDRSVSLYTETIEHVFLFNFLCELLVSLVKLSINVFQAFKHFQLYVVQLVTYSLFDQLYYFYCISFSQSMLYFVLVFVCLLLLIFLELLVNMKKIQHQLIIFIP